MLVCGFGGEGGEFGRNSVISPPRAPFMGVGDVQASNWNAYWGLRSFSVATAGNNAADVRCVTAARTVTIKTLASGDFDLATLVADCPNDTYFVSQLYDSSGANACSGSPCNLTQATSALQPQLVLNCINGLPCLQFDGATTFLSNTSFSLVQPWTMLGVGIRTNETGAFDIMIAGGQAANPNLGFSSSFGNINFRPGSGNITLSVGTEDTWEACIGYASGSNSTSQVQCNSNGPTSPTNGGTSALSEVSMGYDIGANEWYLHGQMVEGGIGTFTINTSLISNIRTYWGF